MSEEFKKPETMSWDEHLKAGMDGLKDEMRDSIGAGETISNVRKHSRTAMKEALLAWRSLIDGAIERLSGHGATFVRIDSLDDIPELGGALDDVPVRPS